MGIGSVSQISNAQWTQLQSKSRTVTKPNSIFPAPQAENQYAQLCQAVSNPASSTTIAIQTKPTHIEFTPAETIEEAAAYAKSLGVKNYNLGNNLEAANYINEGITNLYNRYEGELAMFENVEVTGACDLIAYVPDSRTLRINPSGFLERAQTAAEFIHDKLENPAANANGTLGQWYKHAVNGEFDVIRYIDEDFQKETVERIQSYLQNPDSFDVFDMVETYQMISDLSSTMARYQETGELDPQRGYNSGSKFGFIYHEYGHLLHSQRLGNTEYAKLRRSLTPQDKADAMLVSAYAKTNYVEFVADTYKALINGHVLPDEVMALYAKCKGPRLP